MNQSTENPPDNSPPIYSFLDNPVEGGSFIRHLNIKGWAFSAAGGPVDVELFINGQRFRKLPTNVSRADVVDAFHGFDVQEACGFDEIIHWNELKQMDRDIHVLVKITDGDGKENDLGPVTVTKVDTIRIEQARANYKDVWEAAAKSEESAKHAVSGFTNLEKYDNAGAQSAQMLVELTHIKKTDVILEIGCGVGRVGVKLAPLCAKWIGTDVSEKMLAHAKETLLRDLDNIELITTNGYDLVEVPDSTVDIVYSHFVFMHLDEWDRFNYLLEAHRVLKPGGRVYVDNINLCGDQGWQAFEDLAKLDPACRPPNISKTSTPEEMRMFLEKSGFENINVISDSLMVSAVGQKTR